MNISKARCPQCNSTFSFPVSRIGHRVRCPGCKEVIRLDADIVLSKRASQPAPVSNPSQLPIAKPPKPNPIDLNHKLTEKKTTTVWLVVIAAALCLSAFSPWAVGGYLSRADQKKFEMQNKLDQSMQEAMRSANTMVKSLTGKEPSRPQFQQVGTLSGLMGSANMGNKSIFPGLSLISGILFAITGVVVMLFQLLSKNTPTSKRLGMIVAVCGFSLAAFFVIAFLLKLDPSTSRIRDYVEIDQGMIVAWGASPYVSWGAYVSLAIALLGAAVSGYFTIRRNK